MMLVADLRVEGDVVDGLDAAQQRPQPGVHRALQIPAHAAGARAAAAVAAAAHQQREGEADAAGEQEAL